MTGTGRALARYLPAAALFVALIVAWQLAVTVLRVREYLLPAPLTVARAMLGDEIPWLRHLGITSLEIVGAFALAGAAGVALGVVVAWSPLLARALLPFLVFVNTLPKVAVAPLFLLWMGYGVLPNMLIGALIGFFPGRHQHRGGPDPGGRGAAGPGARVQRAQVEGLRQDPDPQRLSVHPERAQDHRDRGGGGRHRRASSSPRSRGSAT